MITCPVCNTKTLDPKKCTQCDSDLEVYTLLEDTTRERHTEAMSMPTTNLIAQKKMPVSLLQNFFSFQNLKTIVLILVLPFLGYLVFLSLDFKNSMLTEMKLERENHRQAQELASQWTEKLIEKQGQVYSDTITKLMQLNDEQKNSLTTIEARLINLEKENTDLANMLKQVSKIKKRPSNNGN